MMRRDEHESEGWLEAKLGARVTMQTFDVCSGLHQQCVCVCLCVPIPCMCVARALVRVSEDNVEGRLRPELE